MTTPSVGQPQRAVALNKTFGQDVSPAAWRSFKDHFLLVKQANIARGLAVWQGATYRAAELRLCLTGAPAEFVREAAAQESQWVENDAEIWDRLESRYVTTEAIEVRILKFEKAYQGQEESLAEFLTRLQRLAGDAFASESADIRRKRVVWRFLDGLIDRDIRERLIRERWMKDESTAKEYDDILKIAEVARTSKQTAALTGGSPQAAGACAAAQRAAAAAPPPPPAARWQRWPGQLRRPGRVSRAARPRRGQVSRPAHVPARVSQAAGWTGPPRLGGVTPFCVSL